MAISRQKHPQTSPSSSPFEAHSPPTSSNCRASPSNQLQQYNTKRVHVVLRSRFTGVKVFRIHVWKCPLWIIGSVLWYDSRVRLVQLLTYAKVTEFAHVIRIKKDVSGLEISMDYTMGLCWMEKNESKRSWRLPFGISSYTRANVSEHAPISMTRFGWPTLLRISTCEYENNVAYIVI